MPATARTGELGGNGQNGNRRRGFDPAMREAMQKYMERPEVKAQQEQMRTQDEKLESQYTAAINKILTPRQRAMVKKMYGAPFDRSSMWPAGGPNPWGGRGGNRPGGAQDTAKAGTTKTAATSAKATTTAKAGDEEDEETTAAKASTPAPAKAKPATTARRKSLRELRGSSSDE